MSWLGNRFKSHEDLLNEVVEIESLKAPSYDMAVTKKELKATYAPCSDQTLRDIIKNFEEVKGSQS